jgi:hypothetical protein
MIIKFLLVGGFVVAAAFLLRGPAHRQIALRRMFGLGLAGVGVTAVIWPDLTTQVANRVGVGRGTDLVLYLAVLGFVFVSIAVYQRISTLESQITKLTRELALHEAESQRREQQRA